MLIMLLYYRKMLTSKLSAKWAMIYSEPISKLACMQADLVNMANGIQPSSVEDFITRRWLLMMSRACLVALEKRVWIWLEYYI